MSGARSPMWVLVLVLVPALIALAAFLLGQFVSGAGILVAAGGATLWTAWTVRRGGEARHG